MNNFVDDESGKIIVALRKDLNNLEKSERFIYNVLHINNFKKVELIFHSKKINMFNEIGDILVIDFGKISKNSLSRILAYISNNPNVVFVEHNKICNVEKIPNDQYFNRLWGMKNSNFPIAWNYFTGNYDTIIGILDTGIDYNHKDLKENMWISKDGKYINGWNFLDDNNNPMDENGHGTHVAGIIGAIGNNFIGVTGANWKIQLAALKIGNGSIDLVSAIKAIYFANQYEIPILNNSWGGGNFSPILNYVIGEYDGLFVVASGNDGLDIDSSPIFPASYNSDNILSVSAIDENENLAEFSNFGKNSSDIAAPGVNIYSTDLNNTYSYKSGTSMATPMVTGAAGLIKSYIPDINTINLKNLILKNVRKKENLDEKIFSSGILDMKKIFENIIQIR